MPSSVASLSQTGMLIVLAVSLAIALQQDYQAWPTDVALLFTAGLLSLVLPFVSHFLNSSEDIKASKSRKTWLFLAGMASLIFPVFFFGACFDRF